VGLINQHQPRRVQINVGQGATVKLRPQAVNAHRQARSVAALDAVAPVPAVPCHAAAARVFGADSIVFQAGRGQLFTDLLNQRHAVGHGHLIRRPCRQGGFNGRLARAGVQLHDHALKGILLHTLLCVEVHPDPHPAPLRAEIVNTFLHSSASSGQPIERSLAGKAQSELRGGGGCAAFLPPPGLFCGPVERGLAPVQLQLKLAEWLGPWRGHLPVLHPRQADTAAVNDLFGRRFRVMWALH